MFAMICVYPEKKQFFKPNTNYLNSEKNGELNKKKSFN